MYMPTASMSPPMVHPVCGAPTLAEQAGAEAEQAARTTVANIPKSVSEAVMDIFRSRPLSAFDWIIIFILIIAAICFFQYAGDLINSLFRTHHHEGGNFCTTCGGTV
jgi:hypothetical protein